jgi:hypothetical protein
MGRPGIKKNKWSGPLRERVKTMVGDIEELTEVWETLHICFDRFERFILEALQYTP